jgi:hypothetical protein
MDARSQHARFNLSRPYTMSYFSRTFGGIRDIWSYRHEPERFVTLAQHYWRTLVVATIIVIIIITLYGALRFVSVLSPDTGGSPVKGGTASFNEADLQLILEAFQGRRAQYSSQLDKAPQIADPSK